MMCAVPHPHRSGLKSTIRIIVWTLDDIGCCSPSQPQQRYHVVQLGTAIRDGAMGLQSKYI